MATAGRKNRYITHVQPKLDLIRAWCRAGLIEKEICKRLGVGLSTFQDYKIRYPELSEALKEGKEDADFRAEDCLFSRVTGFDYDEVTQELTPIYDKEGNITGHEMKVTKVVTKKVIPDVGACMVWLKNRKPADWKDRHDVNLGDNFFLKVLLPEDLRRDGDTDEPADS